MGNVYFITNCYIYEYAELTSEMRRLGWNISTHNVRIIAANYSTVPDTKGTFMCLVEKTDDVDDDDAIYMTVASIYTNPTVEKYMYTDPLPRDYGDSCLVSDNDWKIPIIKIDLRRW